ncbi:spore coat protein [Herbaspirillum sp. meg3]|jgi:spore coat protein U-like protein|uniref:Csu type fimbrial protein n=1 Tax=Herbaspirillum sp. meg3 TaxID=2025949 RepID=UPI000B99B79E|nr:spore coat U domain-containing protein [Herbaspirillum sp. meg3]ASU38679.1 spore coat protein [Herbaspirillum sp. meg3]
MFFVRKHRICCAAAAITIATAGMHMAAHANSTSGVNSSAAVLATCTIVGSAIAFGTYSSTQVDQSGTIAVVCTNGISYSIGLDAGAGTGATTAVRKLTGSSGGTLNYTLYRDAARTSNWGSTIGTDTQAGNGNGIVQNLTVYGRIPSGQTPQTGTYTDTVTITLTY